MNGSSDCRELTAALKHLVLEKVDLVKIIDLIPGKVLFGSTDQTFNEKYQRYQNRLSG